MVITVHLSTPIECTPLGVNINRGLWVITMYQYRCIGWNQRPTLGRDVNHGGGCAGAGA